MTLQMVVKRSFRRVVKYHGMVGILTNNFSSQSDFLRSAWVGGQGFTLTCALCINLLTTNWFQRFASHSGMCLMKKGQIRGLMKRGQIRGLMKRGQIRGLMKRSQIRG